MPEEQDDEEWQDLLASLGARHPERFGEQPGEAEVVDFFKAKIRGFVEMRGEPAEEETP